MEALAAYGSDDDELACRVPDIAPAIDTTGLALVSAGGPAGAGVVVPLAATKALHGAWRSALARCAWSDACCVVQTRHGMLCTTTRSC